MPATRYAKSDGVHIAYQVAGEGPLDLVWVPGWVSHLDLLWEPPHRRFLERLASFSRVILVDKRGTGLSDPVATSELPTLEERMDDLRAVLDRVGSRRAALFGASEGGPMCALFAATYPERTTALVMYGAYCRWHADPPSFPWGVDRDASLTFIDALERTWGDNADLLHVWAPSVAEDELVRTWWNRVLRTSASPGAAAALAQMNVEIDIRRVLPTIHVPTLVLHRTRDMVVDVHQSRYIADRIPKARLVELEGADHLWTFGDQDAIVDEVQEFLTGVRPAPESDRVLGTIVFTDIVASTERAAELGDRQWRDVLAAHDDLVRRELVRYRGTLVKTTGDGILAMFDGPARAVRFATEIRDGVRRFGMEIRTGVHTGEVEVLEGDLGGIAVHIGARVMAVAEPGEVLVSGTVRDLVAGSGLQFDDRGEHELKGVPGAWRLLAVRA